MLNIRKALARFGFVEEDPASAADGRHRPWRAKVSAFSFGQNPGQTTAARAAGRVLRESVLTHYQQLRQRFYDQIDAYPEPWREAAGATHEYVHVTPDELAALHLELREVTGRYRRLERPERPDGAQRVQVSVELTPAFAPEAGR